MANIMYEIPSRADIDKVIITGATVKGSAPEYVLKRDIISYLEGFSHKYYALVDNHKIYFSND